LHSENATAVGELPLVLKAAVGVHSFEGSDSHDEIINEFNGDGSPTAIQVVVPLIEDYLVLIGAFDICRVEDDLAEVNVGNLGILEEGGVEAVDGGTDDGGSDVELN
jgi:hypothetical protein